LDTRRVAEGDQNTSGAGTNQILDRCYRPTVAAIELASAGEQGDAKLIGFFCRRFPRFDEERNRLCLGDEADDGLVVGLRPGRVGERQKVRGQETRDHGA